MALKQKIYETQEEKKKDFRLGIALWFGLNVVLALCSWGGLALLFSTTMTVEPGSFESTLFSLASIVINLMPWLINIGLIIYFAFTRSQIAYGMLAGFGIAFVIVILLGVILAVWCFVSLGSGGY